MRVFVVPALLFVAAAICGCAGYRELGWPGCLGAPNAEFESSVDLQAGQRVRITTIDGGVVGGSLVELELSAVTVAADAPPGNARVIVAADVARIEVHTPVSWRPIRTAALVVAGSLATYVVIDKLTDRQTFTTDWEPAKRR